MTCPHDCFCHVEGDRGLEGEGAGSALNPFVIEPAEGRTIPRTAATAAALPILAAEEDGQLAFVNDTALVYRFNGTTLLWEGVGPEWAQIFPSVVDVGAAGSNVYGVTTEFLALTAGRWNIHANGALLVDFDFIDPGDQTGQPDGSFGVDAIEPSFLLAIYDAVSATELAFNEIEVSSETFWLYGGGFQYNLGRQRRFIIPFHMQVALDGPRDVHIRAKWTPPGLDNWGQAELRNLIIKATRVNNQNMNQ